jgi:hypothetical protein
MSSAWSQAYQGRSIQKIKEKKNTEIRGDSIIRFL